MGVQLWWVYDILAVAVLLICIYLSGKKGVFKSVITSVGCIVGAVIAVSVSGAVSDSLYKTTVRDGNISKLEKTLIDTDISSYMGNALEGMGYNVVVSTKKLDEIFDSDKDVDEQLYKYMNNINGKVVDDEENFQKNLLECYAMVMKRLISDDVSKYAVETASRKITDGDVDFGSLIKQIKDSDQRKDVARIISDDYIADAYKNVIRLVAVTILFVIIFIITILTVKAVTAGQRETENSKGSHIAGGICGIITGVVILFMTAVILRLYCIMGNNEMLFFGNEAVDKTYIFRYAYDFFKL
ncbi:MAG: hypothetical protein K2I80_06700 [Ruminococcus sp.]|nr:hypothetical protein [Ruminococcus sp.]MDE6848819.1 hypothetical protein [Ruminococcus sp.]